MTRFLGAVSSILSAALLPLSAAAATIPSLSPPLETTLARPPAADYAELITSAFHGHFTAQDWASGATTALPLDVEAMLAHNGFVDGFGMTWTSASTQRGLIEVAMAFTGAKGARAVLVAQEAADKADALYQRPNTLAGISPSYGGHAVDAANSIYEDFYAFVKGNDLFAVLLVSRKDDVQSLAAKQARAQFYAAPESTIPASKWPENAARAANTAPAYLAARLLSLLMLGALVLVVIGVVVGLLRRGRRRAVPPFS
jgi:hypothetical protein